jgi:hypothetical protein
MGAGCTAIQEKILDFRHTSREFRHKIHEFAKNSGVSQQSRPRIAGGIFIGIPLQPRYGPELAANYKLQHIISQELFIILSS